MNIELLPVGFEPNIDVANEEIQRLSAKLGIKSPDFIPTIHKANDKIIELNAEAAKKTDVVARPTPKSNVAPRPTDPPTVSKAKQPEVTGLHRAIAANIAKAGRPVHTTTSNYKPTGLFRAIEANIKAQRSKPNTDEHND